MTSSPPTAKLASLEHFIMDTSPQSSTSACWTCAAPAVKRAANVLFSVQSNTPSSRQARRAPEAYCDRVTRSPILSRTTHFPLEAPANQGPVLKKANARLQERTILIKERIQ